jgi:hypothetical protein
MKEPPIDREAGSKAMGKLLLMLAGIVLLTGFTLAGFHKLTYSWGSSIVYDPKNNVYGMQVTNLYFDDRGRTVVSVRVMDESPVPTFEKFRKERVNRYSTSLIGVKVGDEELNASQLQNVETPIIVDGGRPANSSPTIRDADIKLYFPNVEGVQEATSFKLNYLDFPTTPIIITGPLGLMNGYAPGEVLYLPIGVCIFFLIFAVMFLNMSAQTKVQQKNEEDRVKKRAELEEKVKKARADVRESLPKSIQEVVDDLFGDGDISADKLPSLEGKSKGALERLRLETIREIKELEQRVNNWKDTWQDIAKDRIPGGLSPGAAQLLPTLDGTKRKLQAKRKFLMLIEDQLEIVEAPVSGPSSPEGDILKKISFIMQTRVGILQEAERIKQTTPPEFHSLIDREARKQIDKLRNAE